MPADLSRVRLNPLLDYAGVELKQGGVVLDADANELVAILDRRLRALASDTLGRATVSSTTPNAFKVTAVGGSLRIDRGRLYVDGLLAENHGSTSTPSTPVFDDLLCERAFSDPIEYAAQPYLPNAPALPAGGRHLVYLDVWDREVTHLEQPALVESAVAVETSSRRQTVWQVRVLADEAGNSLCTSPDADVPGWSAFIAPSTGVLSTGTFQVTASDDPCELPPTGGYRGLENQLYRIEIHDAGQPGGGATFKWSRENASVGSRVASMISAGELELESLGRDDVLRFNTGDWVEINDDVREFSQRPGEMRKITVDDATKRISFSPALPAEFLPASFPSSDFPRSRNLRVRRWDQRGFVFRTDASGTPVQVQDLDAGTSGVISVPAAGTTLLLEHGVTVSFASTGAKGFRAGDHWEFAARTADASVEALDRAPPRGVHHHYARLGIWDVAAGSVSDCRHPWPPETGRGDCCCDVCVTPESHASGQLTLQAAIDRVAESGGTVCLKVGQYVLSEPVRLSGARSVRVHGQGAATVITAPGGAFVVERSVAIAIERLTVISLGRESAFRIQGALGLALRELVIAVVGGADARGAGITLGGVIAGATVEDNLILASDGIRTPERDSEERPNYLLSAALRIEHNAFLCQQHGVSLSGLAAHFLGTSVSANEIVGARAAGVEALGFALPGASMRLCDNDLTTNGPAIRCGVDGAFVQRNKLLAVAQGDREPRGSGIELGVGLDPSGSDQCHVLENQIRGYSDAGILVAAPAQELLIQLNIVEACGNGIVMSDAAAAGSLTIADNHLRDIGGERAAGALGGATVGIGVVRTEAASISGNVLRRIGSEAALTKQLIAGILSLTVQRSRVFGNEIRELGPSTDFGGPIAGILIRGPYAQADVAQNQVERDATPVQQPSTTAWQALVISEPRNVPNAVGVPSRLARFTLVRVDETRTLVLAGNRAWVDLGAVLDAAGAVVSSGSSAAVLGNVLVARGRSPAVEVAASGELQFSDNRCELRANRTTTAVLLDAPVAVIASNRVRGAEASISVPNANAAVAAIGNITTNGIHAPLKPEMVPLNLIA